MNKELNKILLGELTYKNDCCRATENEELESIICRLVHGDNDFEDEIESEKFDIHTKDRRYNF